MTSSSVYSDDSEDQSFGDEFEDGIEAIGSCEALYDYEGDCDVINDVV